ncbi:hypothetical protein IV203_036706 [Nitzschia inconspicua]|uniref:Uncharacterized protein n=1 Tax=Nitzschia inconspicua TaxID=303405 RepID=A0A9K3LGU7_9STRA|nr:hypothetical protein IV203_036706 [Nitzschia inconspicua]
MMNRAEVRVMGVLCEKFGLSMCNVLLDTETDRDHRGKVRVGKGHSKVGKRFPGRKKAISSRQKAAGVPRTFSSGVRCKPEMWFGWAHSQRRPPAWGMTENQLQRVWNEARKQKLWNKEGVAWLRCIQSKQALSRAKEGEVVKAKGRRSTTRVQLRGVVGPNCNGERLHGA